MAKRYLISTAGYPNFGDEQIVRTWLKFYRENFPDDQLILDVPFPARASFLFQDELPYVQFVDTIWNLVYLAHDQQLTLENESEVSAILHGGDPRNNVPIAALFDSDVIHLLGGGYFSTAYQEFSYTYLFFMLLALVKRDRPDTQLYATGIGLTPITDDITANLACYTDVFSYIGVRDRASTVVANTTFEYDDVVMAPKLEAIKQDDRPDNPDVLLMIQPFKQDTQQEKFIQLLVAYLRQPSHRDKKIGIVEAMIPGDNWLFYSEALQDYPDIQQRLTFYGFWDIWQHGIPVKANQEWVTTRFHFHLIGALLGYRGTAINPGDDYYDVKHQSLVDLGTSWQYIDLATATNVAIKPTFRQIAKLKLACATQKKIKRMKQLFIDEGRNV